MSFRYEHGQITDNYDEQEAIDSWYQECPIVTAEIVLAQDGIDDKEITALVDGIGYDVDGNEYKIGDIVEGQIIKGKFIPL